MTRTLFALAFGAAAGAGAMYLLMSDRSDAVRPVERRVTDTAPTARSPSSDLPAPPERAGNVERAELYRRAADAGVAELQSMITSAAAQPVSTERDFALDALLARYAEIDARQAAALAHDVGIRGARLAPIYARWAASDPTAALDALRAVDDSHDVAEIGLALMAALGDDARAIERVAAVLAQREPAERTGAGPVTAFSPFISPTMAFAGPGGRQSVLARIAENWAKRNPADALAIVGGIRDSGVRAIFESAVLREWARFEPDAMLAHLATLDADLQRRVLFGGALGDIARADPLSVLETAAKFSTDVRGSLEQAALQTLAQEDPLSALRLVERLPSGMQRQQLLQVIAHSYGQKDPVAALAWARATPAPQRNLGAAVISGIAAVDPDRAFDLATEITTPIERVQALHSVIAASVMKSDADAEDMADRVIALGDQGMRDGTWMMLLSVWSSRSPDRAMEWLLSNTERAPREVFQQIGQQFGLRDPGSAAAHTARIPAEAREQWIQGVAMGYAQNDAPAAVEWLGQFRGEPAYASSVVNVATVVAQQDGAAAARLLDGIEGEIDPQLSIGIAATIANNWANHDPAAAAEWALDRPDEQARSMAVSNVIGIWANSNLESARQWTLRLPQNQLRDTSLTTLLTAASTSGAGTLDAVVMNAFSGDRARQQALLQVVMNVARNDPVQARRIVDYYVTDPAMRVQAEAMIDRAQNGPRSTMGSGSNIGVLNEVRTR